MKNLLEILRFAQDDKNYLTWLMTKKYLNCIIIFRSFQEVLQRKAIWNLLRIKDEIATRAKHARNDTLCINYSHSNMIDEIKYLKLVMINKLLFNDAFQLFAKM